MTNQSIVITRTCRCNSSEIFTYRDWQKHGFQVQKGEHGIKETENRVAWNGSEYDAHPVKFCLCQVQEFPHGYNRQHPHLSKKVDDK